MTADVTASVALAVVMRVQPRSLISLSLTIVFRVPHPASRIPHPASRE
jgi:hypothetical protein